MKIKEKRPKYLHACASVFPAPHAQSAALSGATTLSDAAAYPIGVKNKNKKKRTYSRRRLVSNRAAVTFGRHFWPLLPAAFPALTLGRHS